MQCRACYQDPGDDDTGVKRPLCRGQRRALSVIASRRDLRRSEVDIPTDGDTDGPEYGMLRMESNRSETRHIKITLHSNKVPSTGQVARLPKGRTNGEPCEVKPPAAK